MRYDYIIVGAGFFGCVIAERIANKLNNKVLLIDKRNHIGGNSYSEIDKETGIEFHKYGTHIFHTSEQKVWNYIKKFSDFNNYQHQVLTTYKNKVYQMPINLETINSFYNINLKPYEVQNFLKKEINKTNIKNPKNFEEKAITLIGKPLYNAFIKGYTKKQWGLDPFLLPDSILSRLPIRYNYDRTYFKHARWQGIPLGGYEEIFKKMTKSSNINVILNCDYLKNKKKYQYNKKLIFTGSIDAFFDFCYGKLEYRSVYFEKRYFNFKDFQGTSVMNYAEDKINYTRIHEPRHLHLERNYNERKTVVLYEYSTDNEKQPYYPINNDRNHNLYLKYKNLSEKESKIIFGGRLGSYSYYDMDQVIKKALECFDKEIKNV